MDSTSIAMLVALVALVAMSGYFSATETAFTSLNRIRLKNKADNGDRRAARTLELAEDYDRLLSTILIGNNIVNNVATTIGAVLFIKLIDDVRGPTVSAIVLTIVILIFGEVSPKSLAKENPEGWAMIAAPLLRLLVVILTPANFLFTQWKRLLSKVFRTAQGDGITEEELVGMVDQAENEGGLDQHESDLIRNAIEFNDLEVSEILTPRVDLVAVPDTATMEQAASLFVESGTRRTSTPPATAVRPVWPISRRPSCTPPATPRSPSCCASSRRTRPTWPWWWMSTAALKASPPWRTSWRSWWARSGMNTMR